MKIISIWSQTIIFIYTSNYLKSFANFAPLISKVIMQKTSITEIMGKFSNKILEYVYTYLLYLQSNQDFGHCTFAQFRISSFSHLVRVQ